MTHCLANSPMGPITQHLRQEWATLVQSMAAGDQLALHALYERAHRFVLTLIMRITANRETASSYSNWTPRSGNRSVKSVRFPTFCIRRSLMKLA